MYGYSPPGDIENFLRQIGRTPLIVCDMDGNVMVGYRRTGILSDELTLGAADNPDVQALPFGRTQAALNRLVSQGVLKTGIFAEKSMDARLPEALAALVNRSIAEGEPFRIAFLTSRGCDDARTLLMESGIRHIDRVTLVADSGATLFINGQKTEARTLSDTERYHLSAIDTIAAVVQTDIENIVRDHLGHADGCPPLFVEHKGIATNIHYREILSVYGQAENSPLDKALGAFLKDVLNRHVSNGDIDDFGNPVFKTLDGPATVEMKIASVNKGHGLAAIVAASIAANKAPSSVVFTGDDVAKGNGTPGTDYYAMVQAQGFSCRFGIPFYNIHTHHPVGLDIASPLPDPNKSPETLSAAFPKPPISLVVPTPAALSSIILRACGEGRQPPGKPAPDGPVRAFH